MPAARSSDDSYGYELEYDEQGRIVDVRAQGERKRMKA